MFLKIGDHIALYLSPLLAHNVVLQSTSNKFIQPYSKPGPIFCENQAHIDSKMDRFEGPLKGLN